MSHFESIADQFPSKDEIGDATWFVRLKERGKQSRKWLLSQVRLDKDDELIIVRPSDEVREEIYIRAQDVESVKVFSVPKGSRSATGVGTRRFAVSYPRTSKGF